ncbi:MULTISPECIES: PIN domain-containing protein [Pseudoalteromonas]|uniref:PIN domain-containing protein n=1 Tax=Pseudoalteromonas TaxID=53246 RepID=UPI0015818229|nr:MULTISPECIES: type II toxin-antitoxin system VapC family toxin [Pseudoalteromonas]MDI4653601.1 type II toxin-antitoxin system VapC family toxin [Pseudoalteromonas shioyasakiensis]NUJ39365.1 type II toxin-antitoxin system VapC family toxin [Pseudoalteromonas sp. 0303]
MIAIDTNVLLRYLLQDDEKQANKAAKLILGNQPVLVTDVVLTETIWTLKGKRYTLSKEQIIDVVHALFAEPNLTFEDGQAVWGALKDFTNAKPIKSGGKIKQADFPDALIVNKAKRHGQLYKDKVSTIYTFDKAALEIAGTKQP